MEFTSIRLQMQEIELYEDGQLKIFHYPFNQPNLRYQLVDGGVVVSLSANLEDIIAELVFRKSQKS